MAVDDDPLGGRRPNLRDLSGQTDEKARNRRQTGEFEALAFIFLPLCRHSWCR